MSDSFKKVRFITSAPSLSSFKADWKPGVMMVGRSNVGKSTLINGLVGQKIAFSSKKAGKTKSLNFFLVDESFYLVDAPGYGSTNFATLSTVQFSTMMEEAIPSPLIRCIVLLLDLRRKPGKDDVAFYRYWEDSGKPLLVVLTKCDTMNQKERFQALKTSKELGFNDVICSDGSTDARKKIQSAILSMLKR